MSKLKIDWRSQLIAHGLKSFYQFGTVGGCVTGEIIYDFLYAEEPFDFDPMVKNVLWGKALHSYKKECDARIKSGLYSAEKLKALKTRYYKRNLVNHRLHQLLANDIMVNIDVQPITFLP